MADLNLLQDKRILAAFAAAQKIPGLRGVFKLVAKMVLRGRIKTINDLAENPEFQRIARKLTRTEVNIYTKVLTPIGFPRLVMEKGKVVQVVGKTHARQLISMPSGDRVTKALEQHIDYLQEESFFQKAHKQAKNLRITNRTEQARQFYHNYALSFGVNYRSMDMLRTGGRKISNMLLGRMYFFRYEPTEPRDVYDIYPLIFMLYEDADNFSGINFHYLTPKQRAVLLGQMFMYLNNEDFGATTKLMVKSFRVLLQHDRRFRFAKSAYRQYRPDQVRSKIIQVHPLDWELAITVPTEKFKSFGGSRITSKSVWIENTKRAKAL